MKIKPQPSVVGLNSRFFNPSKYCTSHKNMTGKNHEFFIRNWTIPTQRRETNIFLTFQWILIPRPLISLLGWEVPTDKKKKTALRVE